MSDPNVFLVMLESSKQEQLPVRIFFACHSVMGIVSRIDAGSVTLRTEEGRETLVRLDKIDAVSGS
ncbi:hypothetical protein SAMN04488128_10468 [Chitinophaga eiseniae]|uniref:Uncharacterized protein n=1 Tax=Chitinophaga eiseniae TaxID=634771 RepID=A0A1T4T6Y5_9BACT|nr:hypothetical protein [Chitinophaga eiseniae]SKA36242.1 hypothetical protein SAMN04488128_10468 [Chitinophaga eiseniae]